MFVDRERFPIGWCNAVPVSVDSVHQSVVSSRSISVKTWILRDDEKTLINKTTESLTMKKIVLLTKEIYVY